MIRRLFIGLIVVSSLVISQSYPYWFIFPARVNCKDIAIGYAKSEFYSDSISSGAFYNACENYARNKLTIIDGGQGFWSTEIGNFWMGADYSISFDTAVYLRALEDFKQVESFVYGRFLTVLISKSKCNPPSQLIDFSELKKPSWIKDLPQNLNHVYVIGIAEGYYYESSSWLEAENAARLELGKLVFTKISALSKQNNIEGSEIKKEEIIASLIDCRVIERWVDIEANLYYVLMEMKL